MTASSLPPPYVQYHIRSGFLRVTGTSGDDFNAFSAQPVLVRRFAGVVLMHDWWGLEASTRLLADQLAEAGFVVIAPDLFDGKTANTPAEAQALMQHMDERHAYARLTDALDVLRKTHNTARRYAVVGVGLGGGFAFKVAAQGLNVHAALGRWGRAGLGRVRRG
ncbi:MAG: dienelactone hydrolase family protein [Anaerolineae bacterium]|nr:dienelactone hydrolase family protein [Anaerolineae bacterium]